jgi:hypothetical protein
MRALPAQDHEVDEEGNEDGNDEEGPQPDGRNGVHGQLQG